MPEWAMTGRVPSARSSARLMRASRIDRFQLGQLLAEHELDGRARVADGHRPGERRGRAARCARTRSPPTGDGRAGRRPRRPGGPPACRTRAGVAPLQGEVLPDEHAELVRGFVELRPGDVTVDSDEVEAGLRGEHDVAAQLLGGRLAEGHARRAGVDALEEQPLTVDAEDPAVHRHLPQPRADRTGVAGLVVDRDRDRRGSDSGWSPRARGHHRRGLSTPKVHSTMLVPAARDCSSSRSTASSTVVRMRTVRASSLSSSARTMTLARSGSRRGTARACG